MQNPDNNLNTNIEAERGDVKDTSSQNFFLDTKVKRHKNGVLKTRLQTLILKKGMKEHEFYHSVGISKQYWYFLSWGIFEPTIDLKVKIAQALECDSSVIWQENKELKK